jgi:hypothetical protein
MANMQQAPQQ